MLQYLNLKIVFSQSFGMNLDRQLEPQGVTSTIQIYMRKIDSSWWMQLVPIQLYIFQSNATFVDLTSKPFWLSAKWISLFEILGLVFCSGDSPPSFSMAAVRTSSILEGAVPCCISGYLLPSTGELTPTVQRI
jgi:hypothetical protein